MASGLISKWVWGLSSRLTSAESAAEDAKREAEAAVVRNAALCASLSLKIEAQEKALVEHRVDVAREYVSNATMIGMKQEMMQAFHSVNERLDQMIYFQKNGNIK